MKIALVYYSYEGNTRLVAETLSNKLKCDLIEIKSTNEMESKSFMRFLYGGYKSLIDTEPELIPYDFIYQQYDLIIIGTPVWWFNLTPTINSFLKKEKIENKKIILFCTNNGGLGKTFESMENLLKNNEIIIKKEFIKVLQTSNSIDLVENFFHEIENLIK